jgi:hypothetical protein
MSRRFGRNQRRQARERVAELERALQMDRALLAHVGERKRELEQQIGNAKRMVGRMSVLFEPGATRLDGPARGKMHLFSHSAVMEDDAPFFHAKSKTIPLDVMIATVKSKGGGAFDNAVHCKVMFDDGCWRYAISEAALYAMPEDILVERLAHELAMTIARDLSELKPGRGQQL